MSIREKKLSPLQRVDFVVRKIVPPISNNTIKSSISECANLEIKIKTLVVMSKMNSIQLIKVVYCRISNFKKV